LVDVVLQPCSFLFSFDLNFGLRARINDRESQIAPPAKDRDERDFMSAHGALLVGPETLTQSPLQYLAGTIFGQIRF
jgi:hypothetical protein